MFAMPKANGRKRNWTREQRTATALLRAHADAAGSVAELERDLELNQWHLRTVLSDDRRNFKPDTLRRLMHELGIPYIALTFRHEPVGALVREERKATQC